THKNGIEVNFTSILMSVFWLQRAEFQRTWLFASNAHAYRLYIFKDRSREFLLYFRLAAISEALNSSTVFSVVAIKFLRSFQRQRSASLLFSRALHCSTFFDVFAKLWKLHFSDICMSLSAGAQF
ncbi:hypothetical protein, partial [Delftia acidovorans]|uniref:hypothetical protein n=1 Tax=Delftia acidovorans TaxID=80866 RepID=UPI0035A05CDC